MQQDTLHHAPPSTEESGTPVVQPAAGTPGASPAKDVSGHTPADTLPPVPEVRLPLPGDQPLTCLPPVCTSDYWTDGIVHVEKSDFAASLDTLSGRDLSHTLLQPGGVAGDPVPYRFRNDNFVTITLLLSFFLVAWVVARSRSFLREQAKEFFHPPVARPNLSADRNGAELRGQAFLVCQTCFVLGLLFFDFTQEKQPEVFAQLSPYWTLGVSVGILLLFVGMKAGVYAFVNAVFFTREQRMLWSQTYLLGVLALGAVSLPLALLVVYFDLGFAGMADTFLVLLLTDKILLSYRCFRIFFSYPLGWVHLFLYFCTLEIVPIYLLFRALVYVNGVLPAMISQNIF